LLAPLLLLSLSHSVYAICSQNIVTSLIQLILQEVKIYTDCNWFIYFWKPLTSLNSWLVLCFHLKLKITVLTCLVKSKVITIKINHIRQITSFTYERCSCINLTPHYLLIPAPIQTELLYNWNITSHTLKFHDQHNINNIYIKTYSYNYFCTLLSSTDTHDKEENMQLMWKVMSPCTFKLIACILCH